jgi:short-subunit dehydrogenase
VKDCVCEGFAQCDLNIALALRNTTALPDQEHELIHEGRNRKHFPRGKEPSDSGGSVRISVGSVSRIFSRRRLRGEFRGLPMLRQLEMLRLNNQAIVELTYSLLPGMLERRQKGIINISSTAGFQPIPFASAYSATKAFMTAFSLALEQELRSAGVTVVTVCPGRLRKNGNDESERRARGKWGGIYQSPDEVVEDGLRVLANGGGLTVPGALNKFSVFAQRLIPRRLVPRLVATFSKA